MRGHNSQCIQPNHQGFSSWDARTDPTGSSAHLWHIWQQRSKFQAAPKNCYYGSECIVSARTHKLCSCIPTLIPLLSFGVTPITRVNAHFFTPMTKLSEVDLHFDHVVQSNFAKTISQGVRDTWLTVVRGMLEKINTCFRWPDRLGASPHASSKLPFPCSASLSPLRIAANSSQLRVVCVKKFE